MDDEYMMVGFNIKALTFWGLWPSRIKKYPFLNKLSKIYDRLNVLIFFTFFTSMNVQLFFIWKDIQQLMYNLSISLLYTIIAAKISVLLFDRKREKVSDLFEKIKWFQQKVFNDPNEKNKEILLRFVRVTKLISKSFWVMVFSACVSLVFPSFLALFGISYKVEEDGTITKPLPFSCWLPFDQQKYHTTAFITQIILCLPGTAYVAIWDTLIFCLMMNGICQIKVLQNSLISFGERRKSAYESAVECVQLHQEIIKYVDDLDSLITNIMFLDFVVYALLLCSIGFRAIFNTDLDLPDFVSCAGYLSAVLVQLYLFYWLGNLLMFESVEIANAAWKSNWYLYEKPVSKLLLLLMMRAQKPLKISVGRFYAVNLESFMVILRAWYSYLTLLNQMRDD